MLEFSYNPRRNGLCVHLVIEKGMYEQRSQEGRCDGTSRDNQPDDTEFSSNVALIALLRPPWTFLLI